MSFPGSPGSCRVACQHIFGPFSGAWSDVGRRGNGVLRCLRQPGSAVCVCVFLISIDRATRLTNESVCVCVGVWVCVCFRNSILFGLFGADAFFHASNRSAVGLLFPPGSCIPASFFSGVFVQDGLSVPLRVESVPPCAYMPIPPPCWRSGYIRLRVCWFVFVGSLRLWRQLFFQLGFSPLLHVSSVPGSRQAVVVVVAPTDIAGSRTRPLHAV